MLFSHHQQHGLSCERTRGALERSNEKEARTLTKASEEQKVREHSRLIDGETDARKNKGMCRVAAPGRKCKYTDNRF